MSQPASTGSSSPASDGLCPARPLHRPQARGRSMSVVALGGQAYPAALADQHREDCLCPLRCLEPRPSPTTSSGHGSGKADDIRVARWIERQVSDRLSTLAGDLGEAPANNGLHCDVIQRRSPGDHRQCTFRQYAQGSGGTSTLRRRRLAQAATDPDGVPLGGLVHQVNRITSYHVVETSRRSGPRSRSTRPPRSRTSFTTSTGTSRSRRSRPPARSVHAACGRFWTTC